MNPKKYALIIGCEDYAKYQTGLDKEVNVDFAANDARVFAEYAEKTLGYPKDQIYLLVDPTSSQIKQNIEKLQKAIEIEKAGLKVLIPEGIQDLCCGTPWASKGLTQGYEVMALKTKKEIASFGDWTEKQALH